MADTISIAAWLLITTPVVGMVCVGHPSLIGIWSMGREDFVRTVGAHRRAWVLLNAGFVLASVGTTAGLVALALGLSHDPRHGAALAAAVVVYGIGGVLWCVVLAIRTATTPALADLLAAGSIPEPAEGLVEAATQGIYVAFVALTSVALIALGLVLLLGGELTPLVAATVVACGTLTGVWLLRAGDVIPAVLYVPTLLVGIALLAGWT